MHGGDIYRNKVYLDFSVNINPLGIPKRVKKALADAVETCQNYPDIKNEELRRAIHQMTGADEECILCGNGASELLTGIIHAGNPKKVLLPVPSFYGYERAARSVQAEIIFYEMKKEKCFSLKKDILKDLSEDIDMVFLANPNNPVGNQIEEAVLEEILQRCLEKNITVVVDECFIEFTENWENYSLVGRVKEFPNLIVLRSFTKLFAIPGVRLGYLVCGRNRAEKIGKQLPEWNLSVFAQNAGVAAARETEYIKRSVKGVARERDDLTEKLRQMGIFVYPSAANFLLLKTEYPLYEKLLEQGILIRDCRDYRGLSKGYYRIAVKTKQENERLLGAARKLLREKW